MGSNPLVGFVGEMESDIDKKTTTKLGRMLNCTSLLHILQHIIQ